MLSGPTSGLICADEHNSTGTTAALTTSLPAPCLTHKHSMLAAPPAALGAAIGATTLLSLFRMDSLLDLPMI